MSAASEWLNAITIGEISAAVAAAGGIWVTVKKVAPFIRRVTHFLDDLMGEPGRDGVPARPGVMARLAAHEEKIARIEHEVTPNHGGSLKDAVVRIEKKQEEDRLVRTAIKESGEAMSFVLNAHVREAIKIEEDLRKSIIDNGPARIERLEKVIENVLDDSR